MKQSGHPNWDNSDQNAYISNVQFYGIQHYEYFTVNRFSHHVFMDTSIVPRMQYRGSKGKVTQAKHCCTNHFMQKLTTFLSKLPFSCPSNEHSVSVTCGPHCTFCQLIPSPKPIKAQYRTLGIPWPTMSIFNPPPSSLDFLFYRQNEDFSWEIDSYVYLVLKISSIREFVE